MKEYFKNKKVHCKSLYNKVLLVNEPFQQFFDNELENFEDYVLVTNIPFGIKSKASD